MNTGIRKLRDSRASFELFFEILVSDQLRKLRPAITNHMKRELGSIVFFTSITKRQKKKLIIEESVDLIDK